MRKRRKGVKRDRACVFKRERERERKNKRKTKGRERGGGVEVGLYTSVCVQSKGRERVC